MDIKKLHEIETVYTRTIINEIITKFYNYIVAAEFAEHPYISPHAVTTENHPLYFNEETVGEPITSSMGGNIFR